MEVRDDVMMMSLVPEVKDTVISNATQTHKQTYDGKQIKESKIRNKVKVADAA